MQNVKARFKRSPDGSSWEGEILIPAPLAPVKVATKGANKRDAIARAASAAQMITSNPILASVLPPGTGLAVNGLLKLAQNPTAKTLAKFAGPGAKRLGKALAKIW